MQLKTALLICACLTHSHEMMVLEQNPTMEASRWIMLLKLDPANYSPPQFFFLNSHRTALREDYDNHRVKSPGDSIFLNFRLFFKESWNRLFPPFIRNLLVLQSRSCKIYTLIREYFQTILLQTVSKGRKIGTHPNNNQLGGSEKVLDMLKFNILKTDMETKFC